MTIKEAMKMVWLNSFRFKEVGMYYCPYIPQVLIKEPARSAQQDASGVSPFGDKNDH